jgi:hypothetical protein
LTIESKKRRNTTPGANSTKKGTFSHQFYAAKHITVTNENNGLAEELFPPKQKV